MVIRHAVAEDVEEIRKLAEALRFDPKNPQSGALISVLSEKECFARIEGSRYFYVDEERGDLNGFLVGIGRNLVEELSGEGLFPHGEVLPFLRGQERSFVYGESVGVRESKQRRGVGKALLERWIYESQSDFMKDAYVMLRHSPSGNKPSIAMCEGFGFGFTSQEVEKKGVGHGIYKKVICNWS